MADKKSIEKKKQIWKFKSIFQTGTTIKTLSLFAMDLVNKSIIAVNSQWATLQDIQAVFLNSQDMLQILNLGKH